MKFPRLLLIWLAAMLLPCAVGGAQDAGTVARGFEEGGRFTKAAILLQAAIADTNTPAAERRKLEFELERMSRIRKDYSLKEEDIYIQLHATITNLTPREFSGWISKGWFDLKKIDGKTCFFRCGVENLYYRHPELRARGIHPDDEKTADEERKALLQFVRDVKAETARLNTNYVLPRTCRVVEHAKLAGDVLAPGDAVKAWLPVPRIYPFQYGFKLLKSSFAPIAIAPETSSIRSVYLEVTNKGGAPLEFSLEYEVTSEAVHFTLNPALIQSIDPLEPALNPYLQEAPHVVFTPEMKALSAKIVGSEANPMLKAKKIYDWQCEHLLYSCARQYSTLTNISDYVRRNGYGDCGEQALLFITLCRYNGIPARWQSGWMLFPGHTSGHDWSEIYLAPYGWLPVDPTMGNFVMHLFTALSPQERIEVRDFYFGGLDQWRLIFNSDHSQKLEPPKKYFRSDDVDFQGAEIETAAKNLYSDRFTFELSFNVITNSAAK
ncbi:MAG: transglutaminase-like domain-containing protein [Limisphaerales bacterium]